MKTMLNYITKSAFVLALCLLTGIFTACDDDVINQTDPSNNTQKIEFDCDNGFHELTVTSNWHVESYPSWAAPMEEIGDKTEPITLFVETNIDNNVRNGELVVALSDGSKQKYELLQESRLSDDNNGQIIIKRKDLDLTYGVGYPVNVFLDNDKSKYTVMANTPINFKKLISALEEAGESDAIYLQDQYTSRYESLTGNSTNAIANQLSVNAGIDVEMSGFKLSVEGGYGKNTSSNEKKVYALEEIQHIIGSRYMRGGMLQYFAENGTDIFQPSFNEYCDILRTDPNNKSALKGIVDMYGTHIVTYGALGCELKLSMQMTVTEDISEEDIHAVLDLSHKAVGANVDFKMSNKEKNIASNTNISLVTYGGDNSSYAPTLNMDFDTFRKTVKSKEKLEKWVAGVTNSESTENSLHLIDLQTMPIYELMPTDEARIALRDYIVKDYQKQIYLASDKNYQGPDLYAIGGIPLTENYGCRGHIMLPEIDVEIVAERKKHEWLSKDEFTTVIYSGAIGKVNYDRGFFVGSDTRKPAKFKIKNGSYKLEEFEGLSTGAIQTLYVDITGDITIYPKGVADYYRTINFDNFTYDLTGYDQDYTVKEDITLTGKLNNHNIYIDDNRTLTLSNFTLIGGSIRCVGEAKIIINGSNHIKPAVPYAGIRAPHTNTLVIDADKYASLSIEANNGAAIGTDLAGLGGNIIINGGFFNLSSEFSPAIGSYIGKLGDITINGGEIEARSRNTAAAIGTYRSSCGNIFISKHVTYVYAKCEDAYEAIGRGVEDDTCGTITIENPNLVSCERGL